MVSLIVLQGKRVTGPLDLCHSMSLFFPLQRRLREAVQLLEDYKHGTLRPGVTNEQVTLLEAGRGKKVTNSQPFPCSQNHFLTLHYPLLLCFIPLWTSGFWRRWSGLSHVLGLGRIMEANKAGEAQRQKFGGADMCVSSQFHIQ